jgi:hypothetical protein
MKLYWSYNSIPELADLPEKDRYEICKACFKESNLYQYRYLILFILLTSVSTIIYNTFNGFIVVLLVALITGGIIGIMGQQAAIYMLRPRIREYLILHGKTN